MPRRAFSFTRFALLAAAAAALLLLCCSTAPAMAQEAAASGGGGGGGGGPPCNFNGGSDIVTFCKCIRQWFTSNDDPNAFGKCVSYLNSCEKQGDYGQSVRCCQKLCEAFPEYCYCY